MQRTHKLLIMIWCCCLSIELIASNALVISIPKCGTNLLVKAVNLLTGQQPAPNPYLGNYIDQPIIDEISRSKETRYIHSIYSKNAQSLLEKNHIKAIFIYRDPRDQLVSLICWGQSLDYGWPSFVKNYSFDVCLLKLINSGVAYVPWGALKNINAFYAAFLPWTKCTNICVIRFEDIIGAFGGGSHKKQLQELDKIAKFLGLSCTENEILNVAEHLFGRFSTFREGQIGSWKNYFKPVHKNAFKVIAGQLLIDLGYEKDLNW